MNQILVSEKIYVTKEMKRKKRIYRTLYFFSLFVIIILLTYYVLAEKDRNDQEAIGQEIGMEIEKLVASEDETTARKPLVVSLDEDNTEDPNVQLVNNEPEQQQQQQTTQSTTSSVSTSNGKSYESEAIFEYPKLGIKYPILTDDSEASLKISLCKFWGPAPNTEGNYVIVGHNYKSGKMFGKLYQAQNGDNVTLKDYSGNEKVYKVYDMYTVDPTDLGCTSQMTNGKRELTLITCTEYGKKRRVIKCVEI